MTAFDDELRRKRQALVERVRKNLTKDPARMNRMRVQWDRVADLLAPYFVRDKLKSYEVHMILDRARYAMLEAIEQGVAERSVWVHAMFAAKRPAAPCPKGRRS